MPRSRRTTWPNLNALDYSMGFDLRVRIWRIGWEREVGVWRGGRDRKVFSDGFTQLHIESGVNSVIFPKDSQHGRKSYHWLPNFFSHTLVL